MELDGCDKIYCNIPISFLEKIKKCQNASPADRAGMESLH